MAPIDIRSVIVCDDVRQEDNGKSLLIGVYVGDIVLPRLPSALRLAFYFVGIGREPSGPMEFKIKHSLKNGEHHTVKAQAVIEGAEAGRNGTVVFTGVPFNFDELTELEISVKDGDEWRAIDKKRVVAREQSLISSNEPQQPSERSQPGA